MSRAKNDPGPVPCTFVTTCKHCNTHFYSSGNIPILGETPGQTATRFLNKLAYHIGKKHKEAAVQLMQQQAHVTALWGGIGLLNEFTSDDPVLAKCRDQNRHMLHKMTQKVHVSDQTIEERVRLLRQIDGRLSEVEVLTLMKEFRDVLEESVAGMYPEQPQVVPQVVTNGIAQA
jgi:hypothetical protein